ncbi:hypothetical protein RFI_20841, partial [Reticulomyxa filosa]
NQKGVTIPSQRRWVEYYEELMRLKKQGKAMPPSKNYRLKAIFISGSAPPFKSCTIFNSFEADELYYIYEAKCVCSLRDTNTKKASREGISGSEIIPEEEVILNKDVKIQFDGGLRKQRLFSFWFNTDFVKDGVLRLEKDDVDKVSKKKKPATFSWNCCDCFEITRQLVIRNRGWKNDIYKDCFTGQDAVKWLRNIGTFSSIDACTAFGNLLIKEKIVYCAQRKDETPLPS